MKKVMKNSEMVNIVNGLVAMQERETKSGEKMFPGRIRVIYAIKKNKELLVSLLTPYEESRNELLEEYGTKADENGLVSVRKDCKEKWNKEIGELLNIEVEADIHMIKFEEIDGLSLSMNDLEAIDFMLEAPEGFTK